MTRYKSYALHLLPIALIALVLACIAQQSALASDALTDGSSALLQQSQSQYDSLKSDLAIAENKVTAAEDELAAAQAEQASAQAAINAEIADPGTNEGHKEWTAYGLFQSIRDNAQSGSDKYWDAQCAMDILDGGTNTTGHSYETKQGPAPDGYGASNWANIASNIAWAQRNDAVALDNVKTSVEFLNEFNSIRGEENAAEGTSLRTDIGTNCRQMAISIVQCDASKDYTVSHTMAYSGLENLSWSSLKGVPFSRYQFTDPYVGWYDEEKAIYKAGTDGVTGHYETIVDLNSGYFCEIAGFAVCSYNASFGECCELSTFGDFFDYDMNPTPAVQYSISDFKAIVDDYYAEQEEAGMFGTPSSVRAAHQTALSKANERVSTAKKNLDAAETKLSSAQSALDDFTDLSTNDTVVISGVKNVQYDGNEHKPIPVVTVGSGSDAITLENGTDFKVSYPSSSYTNAGEATVEIVGTGVKGSGNWWGTRQVTFKITKAASSVKIANQTKTYTGKALKYSGKVTKSGSAGKVTYKYYSDAKCTKAVAASKVKAAGTYYVKATLAADANHKAATSAAAKLTVKKAAQAISAKSLTVSYAGKKSGNTKALAANKSVALAKKAKVSAMTAVRYAKANKAGGSKVAVNAKTGKVTLKKGLKKGTYKVKVRLTAAAGKNYKAAKAKTITLTVKVK